MTQTAQTAVRNPHPTLHQQLCRRLLLSLDRLESHEITLTQGLIAETLRVRQEGVTKAMFELQNAGFITYKRGELVAKQVLVQ